MRPCSALSDFGLLHGKRVCARLDGGELCSDGGAMLLPEADWRLREGG